jgi:hypothetical protein
MAKERLDPTTAGGFEWKIEVPTFKNFQSGSRTKDCPYSKFYAWLIKQLGGNKNQLLNVGSVWLSPDDGGKLDSLVKIWIKSHLPYAGKKRLELEFGFYHLDISPATFGKNFKAEWLHPGFAYVKPNPFKEKTNAR